MRAAESAAPLADGELGALFAPAAGADLIALAVSGGADSLALLDAADRWRRAEGRPSVLVLTVDHGLRLEAAAEAATVAAIAAGRGLAARVLTVGSPLPENDVEAAAREARYRLLTRAAREAGASHLLLAHHRDDQAETVLMRLARGSGVFGLAAMRRLVHSDGLAIFRPFLDLSRPRLVATVAAAGLVPVDDPMNRDARFLRTRVRRLMPALTAAGIGPAELAATAARFAAAADAIDACVDRIVRRSVAVDRFAVVTVPLAALREEPEEIRLRLLARVLMAVGGEPYPPRFRRLKALDAAVLAHTGGRFRRSLAGASVEIRKDRVLVYREAGRQGLPSRPIGPGEACIWDHRFAVTVGQGAPSDLVLGPLREAGTKAAGARPAGIPAAAFHVQPSLWLGDRLVAAPTLAAGEGEAGFTASAREIVSERLAEPPRFPSYAGS